MIKLTAISLVVAGLWASSPAMAQNQCDVTCELQRLQKQCDDTTPSQGEASNCFFYEYMSLCVEKTEMENDVCQLQGRIIHDTFEVKAENEKLWMADWTRPAHKQLPERGSFGFEKIGSTTNFESTTDLTIGCAETELYILFRTPDPMSDNSAVALALQDGDVETIDWLAMPHDNRLIVITPDERSDTIKKIRAHAYFSISTKTQFGLKSYVFETGNFEDVYSQMGICAR